MTSISVDIKIYQPSKVIFTKAYLNFGWRKDLSTLKSDIHLGLFGLGEYHIWELKNLYVNRNWSQWLYNNTWHRGR